MTRPRRARGARPESLARGARDLGPYWPAGGHRHPGGVDVDGFHHEALPVVLPVAFALEDEGVVIRVRPGSQLDAALRASVVGFEADDVDPDGVGWSVAVTGVACLPSAASRHWCRAATACMITSTDWSGS